MLTMQMLNLSWGIRCTKSVEYSPRNKPYSHSFEYGTTLKVSIDKDY